MTHDIPYKKLSLAGVPESLVTVIRHLTVKDRGHRYQQPTDLLEDLTLVERGETPVNAVKLPATRTATQRITQRVAAQEAFPTSIPEAAAPRKLPLAAVLLFSAALGLILLGIVLILIYAIR
jgi:hypothetical protein